MIECLVGLVIAVLVAVIVLWILEVVIGTIATPPPQIMTLVRVLVALLVLLYALDCIGVFPGGRLFLFRRCP